MEQFFFIGLIEFRHGFGDGGKNYAIGKLSAGCADLLIPRPFAAITPTHMLNPTPFDIDR